MSGAHNVVTVVIERVQTYKPLTPRELEVAALLNEGYSRAAAAKVLGVQPTTVRFYTEEAAAKIPGDLAPPRFRVVVWFRGAPMHVLEGAGTRQNRTKLRELVAAAHLSSTRADLPKR